MSVSEQPEPVSDGTGREPGGSDSAAEGPTPPSAAAVPESSPPDTIEPEPGTTPEAASTEAAQTEAGIADPVAESETVDADLAEPEVAESEAAEAEVERAAPISRLTWASVVVGLVVFYFLFTFADVWLASRMEYEPPAVGDDQLRAAVVLGAAQYNGEPSPVLRARLDEAADLYEVGEVDYIVVTGGGQATDVTTEAKTGYDYLRETSGIPDERLLLEVQGASTYQSLAATARFLDDEGVSDVVLVTDRYHAKRSILTAEEVGLVPVVSLTPQDPSFGRLVEESLGVSVGRVIGFRRLDRL